MNLKFVHLIGFSAFVLTSIAAYFSVIGMATLFSGAFYQVAIMISGLEFAKLVISSFLYRNWEEIGKVFRIYLMIGVVILMMITSAGIYGFLSSAYSVTDRKIKTIDSEIQLFENNKQTFIFNNKRFEALIEIKNNRINTLTSLRVNQESRIDTLYKKNLFRSVKTTEKIINDANLEIEKCNNQIDSLNKKIQLNLDEISKLDIQIIESNNKDATGEIGPLKYISKLTGKDIDSVVNFFIILLVFIFDPLAVCLVIATNKLLLKEKQPINMNEDKRTTRDKILDKYLKVCKDAVEEDEVFNRFKTHTDYHQVLEHLSKKLGQVHLDLIKKNNPEMLNNKQVWENDKYGSPKLEHYGDLAASPTTLQYINVASNLRNNFNSLDDFSIIEVGGGYGGQAKILYDFWNLKQYTSIDLPEATLLQEKYISKFKYVNFLAIDDSLVDFVEQEFDLFISNYALTEVSNEDQLKYVKKVLLNCKRGYITCNQTLFGMELLQQKFKDTFTIIKDIEGERETNFVIIWGI